MDSALNSSSPPKLLFDPSCFCFNLLAEFQCAANLPRYREPATIRTQVLTCGAILGRAGRRLVLHVSQSWGGLKTRIPLLDSVFHWQIPTSTKLDSTIVT